MQNLNQFSKQDLDKLKSIYKEINFILSKCQDGIEKALCDEERKRAIFHTLITIKEKLDKLCETSLDEKILSLFDEKFKMRIKTTRNIAAHESEELNLRAVKNFILYDLKDTSLKIKGFLDEIYSVERAQGVREVKNNKGKWMKSLVFVLSFLCLGSLLFLGALLFFSEWIEAHNFTYEKLLAYQPSQAYLEKHADEIAQMASWTNANYGYILAAAYSFGISLGVCVFVWFLGFIIKIFKTHKRLFLCLIFPQEYIAYYFFKKDNKNAKI